MRARTFQTKVYLSLLLAIMIKIILCVSNRGADLRKKKSWKHENIIMNLASHKPCEVGTLICTLQRRKLWHGEIAICPGPGRKPREQLNRAPSSGMPALCFSHKIIFPFLHLIIFKRIKLSKPIAMDSKVTFMPSPNAGCSELYGNRSLVKEVFSHFLYMPGVQMI